MDYFDERYKLLKLEDIDLPIENLSNTLTRNNYFFKFHDNSSLTSSAASTGGSRIKIEPVFYLETIQNQCRTLFSKISRFTGVAVGSIGMYISI